MLTKHILFVYIVVGIIYIVYKEVEPVKKLLISLVVLFAAVQAMAFSPAPSDSGSKAIDPMFDTFVSIGDSLTHGFQSGGVDETRQPYTYGNLLAEKMKTVYEQPLLKFPGYLINIEDVGKGNIRWWQYIIPIAGGMRVDDSNQDTLNNFGITGADVATVMDSDGEDGGFYKLVLGKNGASALTQALDRNPTFMSIWIGNNDALGCALWTDITHLSTIEHFQQKYAALVARVTDTSSVEGAVLVNIPNVSAIPYLQPANDPDVPAGSKKAFWNTNVGGVDEVLTPEDIALIEKRTGQFNKIIRNYALANGWAYVDSNTVFNDIVLYGHALKDGNGRDTNRVITADYLGGIFSLDGVHCSSTGYAVVANFLRNEINLTYNTKIKSVDEYDVSTKDTLYNDPYDPRGLINSWIGQAVQFVIELFI